MIPAALYRDAQTYAENSIYLCMICARSPVPHTIEFPRSEQEATVLARLLPEWR